METKVCECCGKELPVSEFIRRNFGLSKCCKKCNGKKIIEGKKKSAQFANLEKSLQDARTLRLQAFTPRELIQELARRGYKGNLTFTEVHNIDIEKL